MNLINNTHAAIETVAPTLAIGEIQLSADRRSTKESPVAESERIRRVVLPANHWGKVESSINDERSQALTDILRAALVKLGSDRLRDQLAETPMLRSVAISDYTIAELLRWSEETATSRGSITFTREQAENWFASSITKANLAAKHGGKTDDQWKAICGFVTNRFGALAAKNHGLVKADDAVKLMAMIAPEDASSSIGTEIIGRLQHIEKQLTAKANEATVSMDDL